MTTVDLKHREIQRALDDAVKWASSDKSRTLFEFEQVLWTKMLALGRLLVALFLAKQVERFCRADYQLGQRSNSCEAGEFLR